MTEIKKEQPADWVQDIVSEARGTEAVRARMRNAGAVAFALARMKAEKQRVGFMPLPFGEYLRGLANVADVALGPVLRWASIQEPGALEPGEAVSAGRLGCMLGFRLEELFLSLKISMAEYAGGAPLPMLAAHRGASGTVTAQECDRALRRLETDWPQDLRCRTDAIIEGAAAGYRQQAAEESAGRV